jgi:hypothetical protein
MAHVDISGHFNHDYVFQCYRLINYQWEQVWQAAFRNTLTNEGKNRWLTGLAIGLSPVTLYVGLKGSGSIVAGDTASSHAGWAENTSFSEANKPTWTPGAVASQSVSNTASPAQFTMNDTFTLNGGFLCTSNSKVMSTGTLVGGGSFTGGDQSGYPNDIIVATVTISIT